MSFVERKSVLLNLILFSAAVMYSLDLIIECIVLFTQRLSYAFRQFIVSPIDILCQHAE